jgi:predicted Zn-dependent protease
MAKQVSRIKINKNIQTKAKSYYLLGIDKINSIDSREFGYIKECDITHHILFKLPKLISKFFIK